MLWKCFLDNLKLVDVSPISKKNGGLDKENFRPVIVLFNVSKVCERIIYCQTDAFMQDKLSNLLTGTIVFHKVLCSTWETI